MAIYDQNTIVATGDVGYGAAISVAIFLIIGLFVVDLRDRSCEWSSSEHGCGGAHAGVAGRPGRRRRRHPAARPTPAVLRARRASSSSTRSSRSSGCSAPRSPPEGDLFVTPVQYIPLHPTLDNFR